MKYDELLSRKYSLRLTPQGLIYEKVPETARIGLFQIIFSILDNPYLNYQHYQYLHKDFCKMLKIKWDWTKTQEVEFARTIETNILECEWFNFYEMCQITYSYLREHGSNNSQQIKPYTYKDFQEQINALLKDEFLGFELKDGIIEKLGNPVTDTQIREVRVLLKEPEYKGADQHFEKAIRALNMRPNPDVENCIKDAVSAIESVGRVIIGDENALLNDIIKDAEKKNVIPQPLDQTFQKIYAYRGNEPGIAHGAVDISKVTVDEAELILAISAAMIIYLVKKRTSLS
jgi:hypothetical protein